jgi:hypothetical protein
VRRFSSHHQRTGSSQHYNRSDPETVIKVRSDELPLRAFVAGLLALSNLRSTLWFHDDSSAQLLYELGMPPR